MLHYYFSIILDSFALLDSLNPISTNKFSKLISIHLPENLLREFVKQSKPFPFGDFFHEFS